MDISTDEEVDSSHSLIRRLHSRASHDITLPSRCRQPCAERKVLLSRVNVFKPEDHGILATDQDVDGRVQSA